MASAYEWMAGQLRDAGVTGPEIERLDRQSQHWLALSPKPPDVTDQ
ncbi:MAG: hypothetical protein WA864_15570 [Acetobacteraceae bacterium]